MDLSVPRLRMIAGPNGSGKSTIKKKLDDLKGSLGDLIVTFVNADEIQDQFRQFGILDFSQFGLSIDIDDLRDFMEQSTQLRRSETSVQALELSLEGDRLSIGKGEPNGYFAATIADFVRSRLLKEGKSFTCETVLSHRSKIDMLREARGLGYKTYLYFVGTDDVQINLARIKNRVLDGGHNVDSTKVTERYDRSMSLLYEAVQTSWRAYVFDNSQDQGDTSLVAEFENGKAVWIESEVPDWFAKHYVALSSDLRLD
ncbi:MAG: hypothetical protein GC165_11375 [Armatimonadetes bacterium]|nr:hypothetical protein [Armatimonadota bacterium]MBS1728277.1 hypothetical protein [Armatimonadota bacterium]